jgi:hypothetical protein
MFKRILLYFILFTSLLTKDGLSYAFDVLKKTVDVSVLSDLPSEDSMEEEGVPEDWCSHAASISVVLQLQIPNLKKTSFPEWNKSELNVLLELVSPPPRMV